MFDGGVRMRGKDGTARLFFLTDNKPEFLTKKKKVYFKKIFPKSIADSPILSSDGSNNVHVSFLLDASSSFSSSRLLTPCFEVQLKLCGMGHNNDLITDVDLPKRRYNGRTPLSPSRYISLLLHLVAVITR